MLIGPVSQARRPLRGLIARPVACCLLLPLIQCAGRASTAATVGDASGDFSIVGDPASSGGAVWTFHGIADGVTYDLTGVLLKPPGPGPFPAVVLSHGSEGSAGFFTSLIGPTMVQWGLVCMATNYTHAAGVPIGAPGDASQPGASQSNILRAHMVHELLGFVGGQIMLQGLKDGWRATVIG